ncbi:MAG TPA: hypothetical protein VHJ17_01350, partial [Thermomonospora sp.]|nr:hypothetical protein [Thermomonospora sp.]
MTPPTGGTPTTTYTDARGRKIELRQYNNTTPTGDHIATRYTYDPADRLVQVTGPGGHQWTSTYDTRGRKSRTTDPDKGTTQYGYDTLDRLIWTQDSRGHRGKVFHDYDALGRKLRTYAADSAGEKGELIALWGYDTVQAGKQSFASRRAPGPDGTIREYKVRADAYDLMGRPTQTSVIIPEGESGLANTYQFTTVYNIDGTVQSHSLPAAGDLPAETLVTSYDEFKRPVKLTGISPYVTGTGYGNIGRLDSMVLSSGGPAIYQSYGYDPATGRMTNHAVLRQDIDGPVRDTTYTHDDAGNIRQITDKASS